MRFCSRFGLGALLLALGIGITMIACGENGSDANGPVVTVYATPT